MMNGSNKEHVLFFRRSLIFSDFPVLLSNLFLVSFGVYQILLSKFLSYYIYVYITYY